MGALARLALVGAVLMAGIGSALAQSTDHATRVQRGLELFQELEYQQAIHELRPIIDDGDADRSDRLIALEITGISHVILDHPVRARRAFEQLLEIDPEHQLVYDDGSPKIREMFEEARAAIIERARIDPPPDKPIDTRVPPDAPVVTQPAQPPIVSPRPAPQPTAWYRRWYVWAGSGVVVGVAATALILSTRSGDPRGSLDPGRITLSP